MLKEKLKSTLFFIKCGIIVALIAAAVIGVPMIKTDFLITVDGQELNLNVDGVYAADALEEVKKNLVGVDYIVNEVVDDKTFLSDIPQLTITTKKKAVVVVDGEEHVYYPYIRSVQEFLSNKDTILFEKVGEIKVEKDEPFISGTVFEIRTLTEDLGVEVRENEALDKGIENVVQEGAPRQTIQLHQTIEGKDGNLLLSKVVSEGNLHIIEQGTKSIAPAVPTDSVWDQLAFCESGGRWNVNTGNGYYGGLQFSAATWTTASNAVGLNIAYASDATREEQILAASWLQGRSGWGQWPHCSKKLGLM